MNPKVMTAKRQMAKSKGPNPNGGKKQPSPQAAKPEAAKPVQQALPDPKATAQCRPQKYSDDRKPDRYIRGRDTEGQ